jgi:hypothetical protein
MADFWMALRGEMKESFVGAIDFVFGRAQRIRSRPGLVFDRPLACKVSYALAISAGMLLSFSTY